MRKPTRSFRSAAALFVLSALGACRAAHGPLPIDPADPQRTWHVYDVRHRDAKRLVNELRSQAAELPELAQSVMLVGSQSNRVIVHSDRAQLDEVLALLSRYDVPGRDPQVAGAAAAPQSAK